MKFDIVLAGVGGQGVLSLAAVIARAAVLDRLQVKQSEVHGMSQRGGAVVAHLRLADGPIQSDLIPLGSARLILSMEPLEALRYLEYLTPAGALGSSIAPVHNISDYPDLGTLLARIRSLPHAVLVDSEHLARLSGAPRAGNMVMVGAAVDWLPIRGDTIARAVSDLFARKGPEVVEQNLRAFRVGHDTPHGVNAAVI